VVSTNITSYGLRDTGYRKQLVTRNLKLETRNPQPGTWNLKL